MTVWIVIIVVLFLAFFVGAWLKSYRGKRKSAHHPDISTRKRLKRFVDRFRHLEGIGN
jgi:hypothetical protein